MEGLEDQAQAAIEGILEQMYTNDTVQVKHSSRNSVMLGVSQVLKNASGSSRPVVSKKLVLRGGISLEGMRWLEEGLLAQAQNNKIEELKFVCLQDVTTLQRAFQCCHKSGIRRLTLDSFLSYARNRHTVVAETIRSGLMVANDEYGDYHESAMNGNDPPVSLGFYDILNGQSGNATHERIDRLGFSKNQETKESSSTLDYLKIVNYPIGVRGMEILAAPFVSTAGLMTLKLMDCDLRSDSANFIAEIIRSSPNLKVLDLSYNRQLFGNFVTREMTIKTLTQRGLKHNISLLHLHMRGVDEDVDRSKLDLQLEINRLIEKNANSAQNLFSVHPAVWCHFLARVSEKPSALYFFLQQSISTWFV